MNKEKSRYAKPCPVCGALIHPFDVHLQGDSFQCPSCGERLKNDRKHIYLVFAVSVLLSGFLMFRHGPGDAGLIILPGGTLVFSLVGFFLWGLIVPPVYKRDRGKPFDKAPSLFLNGRHSEDKETKS
jgi:predicted RNA-binding Zn-ribbon protein involved in translation (DUF1610 family)